MMILRTVSTATSRTKPSTTLWNLHRVVAALIVFGATGDARAQHAPASVSGALSSPSLTQPSPTPQALASKGWPQWGGPNRDFKVSGVDLADRWPDAGPPQRWSRALGEGVSAIVVDADRLFTMYRAGDDEVIVALHAETGHTLWQHRCSGPPRDLELGFGRGPNATPLIVGRQVFTLGFSGLLHAFDIETGDGVWAYDLVDEFGVQPPQFGFAASPLAYHDTVIVVAGGAGHGVMAFAARTGAVVWQAHDFVNCYASPILIRVADQEQLVVLAEREVVGLDPRSGRLLWRFPHFNSCSGNVSTPIWGAGHLFLSSAPNAGSRMLQLSQSGAGTEVTERWATRKMKVGQTNAIRVGGHIFGCSGTARSSFMSVIDAQTGDIGWRERGLPLANMVHADGKFFVLDGKGDLALVTATPQAWTVHATVKLLEAPTWTVPTLVGNHLYIRDHVRIMALDVGRQEHDGDHHQGERR